MTLGKLLWCRAEVPEKQRRTIRRLGRALTRVAPDGQVPDAPWVPVRAAAANVPGDSGWIPASSEAPGPPAFVFPGRPPRRLAGPNDEAASMTATIAAERTKGGPTTREHLSKTMGRAT